VSALRVPMLEGFLHTCLSDCFELGAFVIDGARLIGFFVLGALIIE